MTVNVSRKAVQFDRPYITSY